MTDYDTMEAGPGMDRLVLGAILNYRPDGHHTCMGVILHGGPGPSTDIKQAWAVVDQMRERGWTPTVSAMTGGDEWIASFTAPAEGRDGTGSGRTAQLAICRAALKAMA